MSLVSVMAVDPGHVSGCVRALISPDSGEIRSFTVAEVPGGVAGLAEWVGEWFDFRSGESWAHADLVIVEDFIINAGTWQKSREDAVQDAIDGLGFIKGVAALMLADLEVIAPDGHKTFNQTTPKGKGTKVQMLNLAPRTDDGHAEDGASLFLVGMKRRYPKVMAKLMREIL